MPTPFTHLEITNRLLDDARIPESLRHQLAAERPAFLLGGIIADARIPPDGKRHDTHFYRYDQPMPDHPWREMFRQNPEIDQPKSAAHLAFLAGYVAHLAADEYWSRHVLAPYFRDGDWGEDVRSRFFILHLLLIHMDERDETTLMEDHATILRQCISNDWLPFMPDTVVHEWRDFIASQIETESQTLDIFGKRTRTEPEKLRQLVDDANYMQDHLWQHITPAMLVEIEHSLYEFAREQLLVYLGEQNGDRSDSN